VFLPILTYYMPLFTQLIPQFNFSCTHVRVFSSVDGNKKAVKGSKAGAEAGAISEGETEAPTPVDPAKVCMSLDTPIMCLLLAITVLHRGSMLV